MNFSARAILDDFDPIEVSRSPRGEVDHQAEVWGEVWGVDDPIPTPHFPPHLNSHPMPTKEELYLALRAFPCNASRGLDAYNARILLRMAPAILEGLLVHFHMCEILGGWPTVASMVLIPLLPEESGVYAPLGFFRPSLALGCACANMSSLSGNGCTTGSFSLLAGERCRRAVMDSSQPPRTRRTQCHCRGCVLGGW